MATPPSGSSQGGPSPYSNQNSNPYISFRGRGNYGRRGRGRGNRGQRGPFTYIGRSNENHSGAHTQHGDMKTGLFKDSFLEDPWKELIYGKKRKQLDIEVKSQPPQIKEQEFGGDVSDEGGEGEILLSDDEDYLNESKDGVVGLGDGLVEAAREVS
jgi:hypothetical protein